MEMRSAIKVLAMLLLLGASVSSGADVRMDVEPRIARLGEPLRLSFIIEGESSAPQPSLPQIPGFQVRSTGRQTSISFGSGGGGSSITYTFALQSTQTGKFQIGPFRYELDGKVIDLPAVPVEIVAPGQQGSAEGQTLSDLLFSRMEIVPTNLYPQQSFEIILSVYSKGLNLTRELQIGGLDQTGLRLQQFQEIQGTREVVRGEVFDVRRYRTRAAALTAGPFNLAPTLRVGIVIPRDRSRSSRFGDSFFDEIFFGGNEVRPYDLAPTPLSFTVNALPAEGRPVEYSGAVGEFDFDVALKPNAIKAGDPVTVTFALSGRGNIDVVSPPQWVEGDQFRIYEPKLVSREIDDQRGEGRVLFEQVIIPRTGLATNLPALTFAYFDPAKGVYEKKTRGPFTIQVEGPTNMAAQIVGAAAASSSYGETKYLGMDIGYLKASPSRWIHTTRPFWFESTGVLAVQALPPVALAFLFFFLRRRDQLTRNVSLARRLVAPKSARAAIRDAETALAAGNRAAFYEALWRAISGYFGNRFNLAPGEVSVDMIAARLRKAGADPAKIGDIESIAARCDLERFSRNSASPWTAPEIEEARTQVATLGSMLNYCEKVRLS